MPLWRCPHCATPQPESSRCWLCGRSTTTCSACRHYRRGVAGGLGLCAVDRRRRGLHGTEVLPCWEPTPAPIDGAGRTPAGLSAPEREPLAHRTFVPVDELRAREAAAPAAASAPASAATPTRWSLWGDPDN